MCTMYALRTHNEFDGKKTNRIVPFGYINYCTKFVLLNDQKENEMTNIKYHYIFSLNHKVRPFHDATSYLLLYNALNLDSNWRIAEKNLSRIWLFDILFIFLLSTFISIFFRSGEKKLFEVSDWSISIILSFLSARQWCHTHEIMFGGTYIHTPNAIYIYFSKEFQVHFIATSTLRQFSTVFRIE